jgi:23S rRNA (cytidine1920-2'-O)/16S rRNA (cytidine1409-2'-O)-methyltransferase
VSKSDRQFVSRGGEKLAGALDGFCIDPTGWSCVDLGVNVGGFTDCLLQRGASQVYAIDTGYGTLAWTLRKDPRVVTMERTNALHTDPVAAVDIAVCDVSWTPLERIVPVAMSWLKPGGIVVALLKPHFELAKLLRKPGRALPKKLDPAKLDETAITVQERLAAIGLVPEAGVRSSIVGKGGNREYLLLFRK